MSVVNHVLSTILGSEQDFSCQWCALDTSLYLDKMACIASCMILKQLLKCRAQWCVDVSFTPYFATAALRILQSYSLQ